MGMHAVGEHKGMIDATHELPMSRQAELLAILRSNLYYLVRQGAAQP